MKGGLYIGYIVAIMGRFLCSFLSGFLFFGEYAPEGMNPVVYSFIYNITYIGVEGILTLIVLALPPVRKALEVEKNKLSV
jgi:thiamine transporter